MNRETPMGRFFGRVQHFFAKNAQRKNPLKTAVYRLDESLDVAGTAFCEFVVPRGTIAGERRSWRPVEHRALYFDRFCPLTFVGYATMQGHDPVTNTVRRNVVCAHFVMQGVDKWMKSPDIYVNKRYHEVFGTVATRFYYQRDGIIIYATMDETAPALGAVVQYVPKGGE